MRGLMRSPVDGGPGIPGPVLCGFHEVFEESWGDPRTPLPLLTITPSRIGKVLLPFRCPRCRVVAQDLACPESRENYHDTRQGRDNYFCPSCGLRFRIDLRGAPLSRCIEPGEDVGPSLVERGGVSAWQDDVAEDVDGRSISGRSGVGDFVLGLVGTVLGVSRKPSRGRIGAFALLGRTAGRRSR